MNLYLKSAVLLFQQELIAAYHLAEDNGDKEIMESLKNLMILSDELFYYSFKEVLG